MVLTEDYNKGYNDGVEDALRFIDTLDFLPPKNANRRGKIGIIAFDKRDKENINLKEYEYFKALHYDVKWLQENFKFWKPVDKIHMTWLNS